MQDRESIRDMPRMVEAVKLDLAVIEDQWGVKIHEFGFSTFSPTPETLEITQLRKLAEEKLELFRHFRDAGLGVEAAVALISGSVVSLRPIEPRKKAAAPVVDGRRPPEEPDEVDELMAEHRGRRHAQEAVRPTCSKRSSPGCSAMPGWAWHLLLSWGRQHPASAILVAVAIVRSFGTTVQTGWAGVLFSFGRATKVLEPGFHPLIPIFQKVRQTPIRSITLDLPRQRVTTGDGLVFDVHANIIYRVEDPILALTAIDDVRKGILTLMPLLVLALMRQHDGDSLLTPHALDAELTTQAARSAGPLGRRRRAGRPRHHRADRADDAPDATRPAHRRAAALLGLAGDVPAEVVVALVTTGRVPQGRSHAKYHRRKHTVWARQYKACDRRCSGPGAISGVPLRGRGGPPGRAPRVEDAIHADFEDLSTHMAYADYLGDKGDPRGEYIQAQLRMEDETRQDTASRFAS